jgi:uncharacterized damage-inducible protein DinB
MTASPAPRQAPGSRVIVAQVAGERDMLESWLEFHRQTLVRKCADLGPEDLARHAVPPSSLSLLGLVRHMTEVERHWFQRVLTATGARPLYVSKEARDADFDGAAPENSDASLAALQAEWEASRRAAAGFDDLDDLARSTRSGEVGLRWILVHMIEEYARHNGHADLLRECIDGRVGS